MVGESWIHQLLSVAQYLLFGTDPNDELMTNDGHGSLSSMVILGKEVCIFH